LDTLAKLQNTNIQNERRYTLNLIIAFSVLAVLTVIGVWGGSSLNSKVKNQDVKFKNEAYLNAVNARKILEDEFDREKRGSAAAFEVYQRIEQGLYEESIEKFVEVRDQLTHPAEIALLEQRIDEIQWKLAENAYHDGVMLFNASNFEQARDAFFKSLSHKENTAYSPRLNYYLAMSLFELGDFEGARRYFAYINSADLSSDMDAQARYYRAIAAEKLGDEAEAYEQFDQFLRKYRYHRLAAEAAKHRAKVESGRRQ
jgi:tetratricopeptide (TPR) repeat protein